METLNLQEIQKNLVVCGVKSENPVEDIDLVVQATTSKVNENLLFEAQVNTIRLSLIETEGGDFNPALIRFSGKFLPRDVIVYDKKPFIVDTFDHQKGLFLISMDGEEYESAPVGNYPIIGTITI
jgi:hypothetical protein